MRRSPHHPTVRHALLLDAAFAGMSVALDGWQRWSSGGRAPDAGEQRLLPQVYRHLAGASSDPSLQGLAHGYRATWARNRVRVRELARVLRHLKTAGIEALVLKGGALSVVAYGDWGARPMTDFDILVPEARVQDALASLETCGFTPSGPLPSGFLEQHHGVELTCADARLDLHWHLVHECCGDQAVARAIRDSSVPLELDGFEARTLCPTDHLFHVIVHGARASAVQPLGWAADALALVSRHHATIDWNRLIELTRQASAAGPVLSAIEWLRGHVPRMVPAEAVASAEALPLPLWQRLEHVVKVRPRRLVGSLPLLYFDHRRVRQRRPRSAGLVTYVRQTFRLERAADLPAEMARLAARRLTPRTADRGPLASLISGTAWMLAGELVVLGSAVAAAGITSRGLGVAGYGTFGLVAAIVYWVEMTVPMLFSRAILGTRAARDAEFEAGVQWLLLTTGLLAAALLVAVAPALGRLLAEPGLAPVILLFATDIPLSALASSQRLLLVGRGRYTRVALVNTSRAIARFAFIAGALWWRPEVGSAVLATIAATVVELLAGGSAIGIGWLRRPRRPALDFRGLVLPLATTSVSLRLFRRMDLLMVQAIGQSPVATGLYGAAQNIALVLTTVNHSLVPSLMSSLARLPEGDVDERRRVASRGVWLMLLPLPAIGAFAAIAPELAALVYGEPFRAAGPLMALLAVASYAEILAAVAGAPLIAASHVRPLLVASVPLLPLAFLAHAWAVPRSGSDGAAMVTLVFTLLSAAIVIRAAHALKLLTIPWRATAIALALSALAYAVATMLTT